MSNLACLFRLGRQWEVCGWRLSQINLGGADRSAVSVWSQRGTFFFIASLLQWNSPLKKCSVSIRAFIIKSFSIPLDDYNFVYDPCLFVLTTVCFSVKLCICVYTCVYEGVVGAYEAGCSGRCRFGSQCVSTGCRGQDTNLRSHCHILPSQDQPELLRDKRYMQPHKEWSTICCLKYFMLFQGCCLSHSCVYAFQMRKISHFI